MIATQQPRTWRRAAVVTVALTVALTLAACSSSDSDPSAGIDASSPSPSPTDDSASVGTPPVAATTGPTTNGAPQTTGVPSTDAVVAVPEALQFSAPLVGGGEFSGAAVADKPTVFWFWAPT